jgi:hypothetical protein
VLRGTVRLGEQLDLSVTKYQEAGHNYKMNLIICNLDRTIIRVSDTRRMLC